MGRGTEERQSRLIHSGGSECLVVTDDEFLRTGWRHRREAWDACAAAGQRAVYSRIVKVIVEGPIARLSTVKVDPLSDLVVSNRIPLAVVRVCPVGVIGSRDVGENPNSGRADQALCGIRPPGKTHCDVKVQPAKLYGSPAVTV